MRAKLLIGFVVIYLGCFTWFCFENLNFYKNPVVRFEIGGYDPRSLFFGDFVEVDYLIDRNIRNNLDSKCASDLGLIINVVDIDDNGIGTALFDRLGNQNEPLKETEMYIKLYCGIVPRVRFAANNYFINEKDADLYINPKYALIGIDKNGKTMVVGLEKEKGVLIVSDKDKTE